MIKRIFIITAFLITTHSSDAFSLVYREVDGLMLYYPERQASIANRLIDSFSSIRNFLERQGLPLKYPLHVILDNKLDRPAVDVRMIPHREIRIPMRAPGVLEDGYLESDPWNYFFFKGLCLQGIYSERSGFYGASGKIFGQLMTPNKIFPEWFKTGISHLLYRIYRGDRYIDPYDSVLFESIELPDMDDISHHPEKWPGRSGYRIFGIPFMVWIYEQYGWQRILEFIRLHGKGLVPIEIDQKARDAFGKSFSELWEIFRSGHHREKPEAADRGLNIVGYWPEPMVYWNHIGIYPGVVSRRMRGRYGHVTRKDGVRLSEYSARGRSRLYEYRSTTPLVFGANHIWDPGPGSVAVSRRGPRPGLLLLPRKQSLWLEQFYRSGKSEAEFVPAPPGALGMSGPVKSDDGRVAVAVNIDGNWDIWVFDSEWQRLTSEQSIEMDPWWESNRLVFSSNISGRFQIHAADMRQLTNCPTAAVLPRKNKFLCLTSTGWRSAAYEVDDLPTIASFNQAADVAESEPHSKMQPPKPYSPFKSLWPNYVRPDGFIAANDFQIGLATSGRDVTGRYGIDAGARYSTDLDYLSVVAGGKAQDFGLRFNRYAISYTPKNTSSVEESRHEVRLSWQPEALRGVEISAESRWYEPLNDSGDIEDEFWGSLSLRRKIGRHQGWINLDVFTGNTQSLFGGFDLWFGEKIYTSVHLLAGNTWGHANRGQHTYRIGGNLTEGYFTQRPTRLFPLRGFEDNILEGKQAYATGVEIYWPLLNLQQGYKTLPLFLHRLRLGTFVDVGAAGDAISADDTLIGTGFELVTSMQIGWGRVSSFRIGLGWPVLQPDDLDESGPVFLIQLGNPL